MNAMLSRELQDLLNTGADETDPRVASIEKMLAQQNYPTQKIQGTPELQNNPTDRTDNPRARQRFPGMPGSPDFPSREDVRTLDREPTDDNLQMFMDSFGESQLDQDSKNYKSGRDRQGNRPSSYVPTPRPRHPGVESDIMGGYTTLPKDQIMEQGADMDPSEMKLMQENNGGALKDEDMLDLVNKGMFKGMGPSQEITGDKERDYKVLESMRDPQDRADWKAELDSFYSMDEPNDREPDMDTDDRRRR